VDLTRSSGIRPAGFREARVAVLGRPELTGAALRSRLSALADDVLTDLLGKAAGHASGVALVAVGSYGRREPAPGSDLDLLLLHNGAVTDLAAVADALWYPLWDSGVGLDHAVRTVTEARVVAAEDLKAALGLLDARHIAGDPRLTSELVQVPARTGGGGAPAPGRGGGPPRSGPWPAPAPAAASPARAGRSARRGDRVGPAP